MSYTHNNVQYHIVFKRSSVYLIIIPLFLRLLSGVAPRRFTLRQERRAEYLIGPIASERGECDLELLFWVRLINLEIRDAVSFLQRDLEDLEWADEGRQSRQALLPTAAHSHQQSVSPRRLQDPVDPAAERREHVKRWDNQLSKA